MPVRWCCLSIGIAGLLFLWSSPIVGALLCYPGKTVRASPWNFELPSVLTGYQSYSLKLLMTIHQDNVGYAPAVDRSAPFSRLDDQMVIEDVFLHPKDTGGMKEALGKQPKKRRLSSSAFIPTTSHAHFLIPHSHLSLVTALSP
nr:hypothetical protein Iba_chr05dCG2590 [Ipomoea batatas]